MTIFLGRVSAQAASTELENRDLNDDPMHAAGQIRDVLGFGLARRVDFSNWSEALTCLAEAA